MSTSIKYVLLFLVCLFSCYKASCNAIDSLKTKEDVRRFLHSNLGPEYKNYKFFRLECAALSNDTSLRKKQKREEYFDWEPVFRNNRFYKVDIDNDGKTDLVVDGSQLLVVMDRGDKYESIYIDGSIIEMKYFFKKMIQLPGHKNALLLRHDEVVGIWPNEKKISATDTLVYQFGTLIEYHQHPPRPSIQKIAFHEQCSAMMGMYDVNYIEISENGRVVYHQPDADPGDSSNLCFGITDGHELNELWRLMELMDMKSLNDQYFERNVCDAGTAILNIYFEDGTVKKISDYDYHGTFGLETLYKKLDTIENSKKIHWWYAASPGKDSYAIDSPMRIRREWHLYETMMKQKNPTGSDEAGETFVDTQWNNDSSQGLNWMITLFPDAHFVYTFRGVYSEKNFRNVIPNDQQVAFSIGNWGSVNDTTIALNWDGLLTVKAAMNRNELEKYINDKHIIPAPVRVEDWRFIYHKGSDTLRPVPFVCSTQAYEK